MTKQEEIIKYVREATRGLINLSVAHAKQIIEIVENYSDCVEVQQLKYDGQDDLYKLTRTYLVNRTKAIKVIEKMKIAKQFQGFYLFRITDLNFEIYTLNINLFDNEK